MFFIASSASSITRLRTPRVFVNSLGPNTTCRSLGQLCESCALEHDGTMAGQKTSKRTSRMASQAFFTELDETDAAIREKLKVLEKVRNEEAEKWWPQRNNVVINNIDIAISNYKRDRAFIRLLKRKAEENILIRRKSNRVPSGSQHGRSQKPAA
uniref:Uncharacterized protein n=1 Tax=Vitrella brassicaformis TaxID=1169539 RepID=A0A7S1P0Q9_9ALVE|mmetsp:Transcript_22504/g.55478  ORF Transcript_22504/g.55478 Transcript_22504/m.55478 type:complete len:155 (+) Transcript_22504:3-467(+)